MYQFIHQNLRPWERAEVASFRGQSRPGDIPAFTFRTDAVGLRDADIIIEDLVGSIETLNVSINKLIEVFATATDMLKKDEPGRHETTIVTSAPHQEVYDKMEALIDQNKIIAQALLNVASMVKNIKKEEVKTKDQVEQVVQRVDVKEPTKLDLRPAKPRFEARFEELQPRQQFVTPMQTPNMPPRPPLPPQRQPASQPMESFFSTGGPIPMSIQGPASPPMPDSIPPLPELPTIGEDEGFGEPKKKGMFGFK